ncbi:hypothetical protein [Nostoc sphaeroides]|uniref:Uncharacterized protein n=1 Tax=Nostoc sphaeroides CCNUC1 TaxID=2653204 RepID=A0A5P8WF46_9NOSO|nr:hypothetical protein [Nostoc sphaeroides]QFS51455.1 hypothetical protein GXM_08949 [Nostoc sphaeroides CCNUC1]
MLALVDAVQSNPASLRDAARTLLAKNLSCGVESSDCHVRVASRREGTCCASPIAQNKFSSTLAIANQAPDFSR